MADPFLGEIRLMSFNFAPLGWTMCSGQLLSIAQNTALFSLLGTTYGGDGYTTFALPDLRGKVPMHFGGSYLLGDSSGVESHTLTTSQLPAHIHYPIASSLLADSNSAGSRVWATTSVSSYHSSTDSTTMITGALSPVGGNQPHSNLQPLLVINFCIATSGIFPQRP